MDNKTLEHFGVLGMHWGVRKDRASGSRKSKASEPKLYGGRALTKQEHSDEAAARAVTTGKSSHPHKERQEADYIIDKAASQSGKNIDKALNRFAAENDLKNAIKKSYIKPPSKNVEEMSTQEINRHLNSDPSIGRALELDYQKSVKRGKIIVGTLMVGVAALAVADAVVDAQNKKLIFDAISNGANKIR